jgi:hypothetical protein
MKLTFVIVLTILGLFVVEWIARAVGLVPAHTPQGSITYQVEGYGDVSYTNVTGGMSTDKVVGSWSKTLDVPAEGAWLYAQNDNSRRNLALYSSDDARRLRALDAALNGTDLTVKILAHGDVVGIQSCNGESCIATVRWH